MAEIHFFKKYKIDSYMDSRTIFDPGFCFMNRPYIDPGDILKKILILYQIREKYDNQHEAAESQTVLMPYHRFLRKR